GVADQPLDAGSDVVHPQPVHGVLGTGRPQEDHPVAVGGHGHRAGRTVGEAAGTGSQFRIVHPGMVTRAPAGCHADRNVEFRSCLLPYPRPAPIRASRPVAAFSSSTPIPTTRRSGPARPWLCTRPPAPE